MSEVVAGTLYVVATPIGHLGDLSPRAGEVLAGVDIVAAEDTRVTRKLLSHLGVGARLVSCHDHNEASRGPWIVARLEEGRSVALVSDAGTPLVSDPGFEVVRQVIAAGRPVCPVPGASAVLAALVVSGLPPDRFLFAGFLPRARGKRRGAIEALAGHPATLVFYEAPQRLRDTLSDLADLLGNRPVCVAQSLTKRREWIARGQLGDIGDQLEDEVRGEWTVVVGGQPHREDPAWGYADALIAELRALGHKPRTVRDVVCRTLGLPRNAVYERVLAGGDAS